MRNPANEGGRGIEGRRKSEREGEELEEERRTRSAPSFLLSSSSASSVLTRCEVDFANCSNFLIYKRKDMTTLINMEHEQRR